MTQLRKAVVGTSSRWGVALLGVSILTAVVVVATQATASDDASSEDEPIEAKAVTSPVQIMSGDTPDGGSWTAFTYVNGRDERCLDVEIVAPATESQKATVGGCFLGDVTGVGAAASPTFTATGVVGARGEVVIAYGKLDGSDSQAGGRVVTITSSTAQPAEGVTSKHGLYVAVLSDPPTMIEYDDVSGQPVRRPYAEPPAE